MVGSHMRYRLIQAITVFFGISLIVLEIESARSLFPWLLTWNIVIPYMFKAILSTFAFVVIIPLMYLKAMRSLVLEKRK